MRWGAWGYTIGSAIFEGKLSQNISLAGQIKAVMAEIEKKEEKLASQRLLFFHT
jgi:hypothetical protein